MGEMRDSDWSRDKMLRSDWLLLIGAIMTTIINNFKAFTTVSVHVYVRILTAKAWHFVGVCAFQIAWVKYQITNSRVLSKNKLVRLSDDVRSTITF